MTEEQWSSLDKILREACDSLKEVGICAHASDENISPDLALLRTLLPSVAQKITVDLT